MYTYMCSIICYGNINRDTITLSHLHYYTGSHGYCIPMRYLCSSSFGHGSATCSWWLSPPDSQGQSTFDVCTYKHMHIHIPSIYTYIWIALFQSTTKASYKQMHQAPSSKITILGIALHKYVNINVRIHMSKDLFRNTNCKFVLDIWNPFFFFNWRLLHFWKELLIYDCRT